MPAPPYAAIGIYKPGENHPSLMCFENKVVVFDHAEMAKQALPLLGNGRICCWDTDGETVFFTPIEPDGINRACVLTNYDVYNLPPGLPVLSETKLMAWKHHIIWSEWWEKQKQERRLD